MGIEYEGTAHRYIALTILLAVIYIVVLSVVTLLQQSSATQQRYEHAQLQLDKYKTVAASLPKAQAEHGRLIKFNGADEHYLNETTLPVAQASLQKKLQQLIQSSGANLISMQAAQSMADGGFLPITMKVRLRSSHQALLKLLYQLESQKPTGFVYDLHIQRSAVARRRQMTTEATVLDVNFDYTVFMAATDDS